MWQGRGRTGCSITTKVRLVPLQSNSNVVTPDGFKMFHNATPTMCDPLFLAVHFMHMQVVRLKLPGTMQSRQEPMHQPMSR